MSSHAHNRPATCTPDGDALPQTVHGTWVLRDVVEVDATGNVTAEPYGREPARRLIYSPDGTMAVVIREHGSSPAVAYAGEARRASGDLLRHVVRVSLTPYTEDQVRHVRLIDASNLVLSSDTLGNPRIELHWSRH